MGSNERRSWDKGAGIFFFSGTSRLCSHVWLKQLDWNCAYAGWGMGGPHTSPGKRPGKCGDTGVPFSTTDSGPNTQAVMGFGGTGHMAHDVRAAAVLRLLHTLSPWHSGISSPHGALWYPLPSESGVKPGISLGFQSLLRMCQMNFRCPMWLLGNLGSDTHLGGQEPSFQIPLLPAM